MTSWFRSDNQQVRRMWDRTAPKYDRMMSYWDGSSSRAVENGRARTPAATCLRSPLERAVTFHSIRKTFG